jgi:hypothetical protein
MPTQRSFGPDLAYLKSLVGAGFEGISQARREAPAPVFAPPLNAVAWTSSAVGALVGMSGARLAGGRKPSRVALGGAIGTLVGFGAAIAWTSRHFTIAAGRSALQLVNATRDAHWLKSNPIDYA